MDAMRIYRAIGCVDEGLLAEAEEYAPRKKRTWARWAALAASAAVVVSAAAVAVRLASDGGPGDSQRNEATMPLQYTGAVLPLSTLEEAELRAERRVELDFSPYDTIADHRGSYYINVRDAYTLTNPTDEDVTVTALYPVMTSLRDYREVTVTLDGRPVELILNPGPTRPDELDSFGDLEELLEDGEYRDSALAEPPELSETVTVYEITNAVCEDRGEAPTLGVVMELDKERSDILLSDFNGYDATSGDGRVVVSFFAGGDDSGKARYIIVRGEDVKSVHIQGYENLGCYQGEEIEAAADMRRFETTLEDIVSRIVAERFELYSAGDDPLLSGSVVSEEQLMREVRRTLGGSVNQLHLGELLLDEISWDRVVYLSFPLTVPAGGSVEVDIMSQRPATRYYPETAQRGVGTYGVAAELGSSLDFTGSWVTSVNTDSVEFVDPTRPGEPIDAAPGPVELTDRLFEVSVTAK